MNIDYDARQFFAENSLESMENNLHALTVLMELRIGSRINEKDHAVIVQMMHDTGLLLYSYTKRGNAGYTI